MPQLSVSRKLPESLNIGLTRYMIAARVMGEPEVPIESNKGEELVAPIIAQPATAEPSSAIAPEVAAKPTKRGSVFGSLFGKKDGTSPNLERKDKEIVPVVPAKDSETVPPATTAPQLDPVANAPPVEGITSEPETAATSPITKAISPGESKGGMFGFLKQKENQKEVCITWWYQKLILIVDRRRKKRRKRLKRKQALM